MLQIRNAITHDVLLQVEAETLEGQNLTGARLDGAKLANANLQFICLRNAQLRGADLSGSRLHSAMLDGADLDAARMEQSDLSLATMLGASLRNVDLRKGVLSYAKLAGADFHFANLEGADLRMADARANFYQANLSNCDLRGANLSAANLQMADLSNADLSGANIAGAVLIGANLRGTKMPAHIPDVPPVTTAPKRTPAPEKAANRFQNGANWSPVARFEFAERTLTCPDCGLRMRDPAPLSDGSFRCRGCQVVFSVRQGDRAGSTKARAKRDEEFLERLAGREVKSKSYSMFTQVALMLAAVASVGLFGFLLLRYYQSTSVPDSLSDRGAFVAEAFARNSAERLKAICKPDSERLVEEWLKRRPARLSIVENGAEVHCNVLQSIELDPLRATVVVQVEAKPPGALGPGGETMSIRLDFERASARANWLLDLSATLAHAPAMY